MLQSWQKEMEEKPTDLTIPKSGNLLKSHFSPTTVAELKQLKVKGTEAKRRLFPEVK